MSVKDMAAIISARIEAGLTPPDERWTPDELARQQQLREQLRTEAGRHFLAEAQGEIPDCCANRTYVETVSAIEAEVAEQDDAAFAEAEHEIHRLEDALGEMGMHVAGIHEAPSQYDGLSGRTCTIASCLEKRAAEIAGHIDEKRITAALHTADRFLGCDACGAPITASRIVRVAEYIRIAFQEPRL
jgi:hypothetical protein